LDNLSKLKDIKPIVSIPDTSLYLFLIFIFIILLVFIYLFYMWYQKNKKPIYFFDLDNPKQTAYKLIEIIRDKDGSEEYIDKLHNYTYKKEVPKFDENLFNEIINKFNLKIK